MNNAILIIVLSLILIIGFIFIYLLLNKKVKPYRIIFLRKEYQTMNVVKILNLSTISEIIKISKKAYKLDMSSPLYNNKMIKIFFLNYDSGSQLVFKEIKRELKPHELDMIIGNKLIKELTSGLIDNKKDKIMMIILGIILGALLSAVIVMMIFQNKIQKILQTQIEDTNPSIPIIPTSLQLIRMLI